jgi:hypothetical protein
LQTNTIRVLSLDFVSALEHLLKPLAAGKALDTIDLLAIDEHHKAREPGDAVLSRKV